MTDATLHVTEAATQESDALTDAFRKAFHDALAGRGDMDERVYAVRGFCGRKYRLFHHNLIRELRGDARYLEVGVYAGATLCPVISGNRVVATAIDNWSWDRDQQIAKAFYTNLAEFKTHESLVTIIERDFHEVPASAIGRSNVYFYDGDHSERSQYDGIVWAMPALDDVAIVLVDDWNWENVRRGTMNALRDVGAHIDHMVELRTSFDDTIPQPAYGASDWHNGFFGAVITKPAS